MSADTVSFAVLERLIARAIDFASGYFRFGPWGPGLISMHSLATRTFRFMIFDTCLALRGGGRTAARCDGMSRARLYRTVLGVVFNRRAISLIGTLGVSVIHTCAHAHAASPKFDLQSITKFRISDLKMKAHKERRNIHIEIL